LDELISATHLLRPLRFAFYLSPATWFQRKRGGTRAERVRLALEELGPIFMKLGQTLSTRRDLLPEDVADELAKLQDRVPPFPGTVARELIELAYARPIGEVFAEFDETPLAAATIAQVHTAKLLDGAEVVAKVVRPGIRDDIELDIEVMYTVAGLALRYWSDAVRLRPIEVVREYEKTILDELDMLREAGNASQLARNFENSALLYAPKVYWDYCRPNVMVMERIRGVLVSDIEELKRRGTNIRRLAENGVEIFFTQVFRHNFFHADMHPGNIFVLTENPEYPRYAAIDFGIVGTLDPRDQHYLAENFLAFFSHDYRRVAQLHIDSGWVPTTTRVDELESAVRTVCEPIYNKPLKEISFAQVLLRLFEAAQRFNITIQPQLILLQKTLLQIEGLGRQLYPDLDLWQTAQPILRDWMRERANPLSVLREFRKQLPDIGEALQLVPRLVTQSINQAAEGRLRLPTESVTLELLRHELREYARRRDLTIVAASLLLGSVVWFAFVNHPLWPGVLLAAGAVITFWNSRRTNTPMTPNRY
jgi:ubiquinone biosynthesis protein